jgi:adenine-specific DNA-methyltransferase
MSPADDTPSQSIERISQNDELAHAGHLAASNIRTLERLFPSVVQDGKVDFDALRQMLGDDVDEGEERFGLNWKGKKRARAFALTPSLGTLRPRRERSLEWDTTQNILVEGDNLEVLKLLRKSYARRVKLIYIDPPYNTGNDLLYPNDYSDSLGAYLERTGQREGDRTLVSNPDSGGRYHSEWLSMMYSRLIAARELLRDDGVLICTIDENELANLLELLKDVFSEGSYDHVCVTIVHNPRGVQGKNFSYTHEYAIFVYRSGEKLICDRTISDEEVDWAPLRNWGTESQRSDAKNCFYPIIVEDGAIVGFGDVTPDDVHPQQTERDGNRFLVYPIDRSGVERKWRYARQSVEQIAHLLQVKKIADGFDILLGKNYSLQKTVWTDQRYDANIYGTQLVSSLVKGSPFTFPKSIWAVYDCVDAVTRDDKEAIILDFFAGSGTTGHATLLLNAADGGRRRYLLVQLPEKIESDRFETIADITKERLRKASEKVKVDHPNAKLDTGFRVYQLATSNLKPWQPDADNLEASLLDAVDNILPDRSEEDLLAELLLKTGIDLTLSSETKEIAGKTVHSLGGGVLMVCLAEIIEGDTEGLGQGLCDWRQDLDPQRATTFYFKDSGFANAATKANLAAIIRQRLGKAGVEKLASI